MNHSLTELNKGFAILIPVILLSFFTFSLAYLLSYEIRNFEHAISRYEQFLDEKYKSKSCENLKNLYTSFDNLYQPSQENSESKLINC